MNNNSILNDIKLLCGIPIEVKDFDMPIALHCNTVFAGLTQMGLGPHTGFYISDDSTTWHDLMGDNVNLHNIKTYVYLKVKMLFDPPANATLLQSMEAQAKECEWRIGIELDYVLGGGTVCPITI